MEQKKNGIPDGPELFSLYKSLVAPFREYENRLFLTRELERKLKKAAEDVKRPIRFDYKRTIKDIFGDTVKWSIPFLIVFYVILNVVPVNGEKLFDYYDELATTLLDLTVEELYVAIYAKTDSGLVTLIYGIVGLILGYALLPCLVLLFPVMIVKNMISEARRVSQAKERKKEASEACENYKKMLPQAAAAAQEAQKRIAPYMDYIPPKYQNSRALAFFSESFFNSRVETLKEAVNLYEQYLVTQRQEENQREIAAAQRRAQEENRAAMNDLARQLDNIQEQIDSQEIVINNYY
ncbi:MAG: hypothetical protein NC123_01985 [Butyrivibrio sp.]|nr:hypothetical protein [Acetatifactor muris]MCM1558309.1 hypothetical protein [Butyrivibrio sp.]